MKLSPSQRYNHLVVSKPSLEALSAPDLAWPSFSVTDYGGMRCIECAVKG